MLKMGEFNQLYETMLERFQTWEALRIFVRSKLGENLSHIAGGTTLSDTIFQLIQWAECQGRIEELRSVLTLTGRNDHESG